MSSIPACRIDVNYLKYADPLFLFSGGNLSLDRTSLRAKSSDESPGEFSCCTAQEISVDEKLRKDRKLRNASKKYRERKERRRQRLEAAQAGASAVSSSTSHEIGSRQQGTIQGVARAVSADEVIFVPLNADGKENDFFLEPNKSPSSGTDDSSEVSSSVEDENESIDIQKIYSADTPLVDMGGWGNYLLPATPFSNASMDVSAPNSPNSRPHANVTSPKRTRGRKKREKSHPQGRQNLSGGQFDSHGSQISSQESGSNSQSSQSDGGASTDIVTKLDFEGKDIRGTPVDGFKERSDSGVKKSRPRPRRLRGGIKSNEDEKDGNVSFRKPFYSSSHALSEIGYSTAVQPDLTETDSPKMHLLETETVTPYVSVENEVNGDIGKSDKGVICNESNETGGKDKIDNSVVEAQEVEGCDAVMVPTSQDLERQLQGERARNRKSSKQSSSQVSRFPKVDWMSDLSQGGRVGAGVNVDTPRLSVAFSAACDTEVVPCDAALTPTSQDLELQLGGERARNRKSSKQSSSQVSRFPKVDWMSDLSQGGRVGAGVNVDTPRLSVAFSAACDTEVLPAIVEERSKQNSTSNMLPKHQSRVGEVSLFTKVDWMTDLSRDLKVGAGVNITEMSRASVLYTAVHDAEVVSAYAEGPESSHLMAKMNKAFDKADDVAISRSLDGTDKELDSSSEDFHFSRSRANQRVQQQGTIADLIEAGRPTKPVTDGSVCSLDTLGSIESLGTSVAGSVGTSVVTVGISAGASVSSGGSAGSSSASIGSKDYWSRRTRKDRREGGHAVPVSGATVAVSAAAAAPASSITATVKTTTSTQQFDAVSATAKIIEATKGGPAVEKPKDGFGDARTLDKSVDGSPGGSSVSSGPDGPGGTPRGSAEKPRARVGEVSRRSRREAPRHSWDEQEIGVRVSSGRLSSSMSRFMGGNKQAFDTLSMTSSSMDDQSLDGFSLDGQSLDGQTFDTISELSDMLVFDAGSQYSEMDYEGISSATEISSSTELRTATMSSPFFAFSSFPPTAASAASSPEVGIVHFSKVSTQTHRAALTSYSAASTQVSPSPSSGAATIGLMSTPPDHASGSGSGVVKRSARTLNSPFKDIAAAATNGSRDSTDSSNSSGFRVASPMLVEGIEIDASVSFCDECWGDSGDAAEGDHPAASEGDHPVASEGDHPVASTTTSTAIVAATPSTLSGASNDGGALSLAPETAAAVRDMADAMLHEDWSRLEQALLASDGGMDLSRWFLQALYDRRRIVKEQDVDVNSESDGSTLAPLPAPSSSSSSSSSAPAAVSGLENSASSTSAAASASAVHAPVAASRSHRPAVLHTSHFEESVSGSMSPLHTPQAASCASPTVETPASHSASSASSTVETEIVIVDAATIPGKAGVTEEEEEEEEVGDSISLPPDRAIQELLLSVDKLPDEDACTDDDVVSAAASAAREPAELLKAPEATLTVTTGAQETLEKSLADPASPAATEAQGDVQVSIGKKKLTSENASNDEKENQKNDKKEDLKNNSKQDFKKPLEVNEPTRKQQQQQLVSSGSSLASFPAPPGSRLSDFARSVLLPRLRSFSDSSGNRSSLTSVAAYALLYALIIAFGERQAVRRLQEEERKGQQETQQRVREEQRLDQEKQRLKKEIQRQSEKEQRQEAQQVDAGDSNADIDDAHWESAMASDYSEQEPQEAAGTSVWQKLVAIAGLISVFSLLLGVGSGLSATPQESAYSSSPSSSPSSAGRVEFEEFDYDRAEVESLDTVYSDMSGDSELFTIPEVDENEELEEKGSEEEKRGLEEEEKEELKRHFSSRSADANHGGSKINAVDSQTMTQEDSAAVSGARNTIGGSPSPSGVSAASLAAPPPVSEVQLRPAWDPLAQQLWRQHKERVHSIYAKRRQRPQRSVLAAGIAAAAAPTDQPAQPTQAAAVTGSSADEGSTHPGPTFSNAAKAESAESPPQSWPPRSLPQSPVLVKAALAVPHPMSSAESVKQHRLEMEQRMAESMMASKPKPDLATVSSSSPTALPMAPSASIVPGAATAEAATVATAERSVVEVNGAPEPALTAAEQKRLELQRRLSASAAHVSAALVLRRPVDPRSDPHATRHGHATSHHSSGGSSHFGPRTWASPAPNSVAGNVSPACVSAAGSAGMEVKRAQVEQTTAVTERFSDGEAVTFDVDGDDSDGEEDDEYDNDEGKRGKAAPDRVCEEDRGASLGELATAYMARSETVAGALQDGIFATAASASGMAPGGVNAAAATAADPVHEAQRIAHHSRLGAAFVKRSDTNESALALQRRQGGVGGNEAYGNDSSGSSGGGARSVGSFRLGAGGVGVGVGVGSRSGSSGPSSAPTPSADWLTTGTAVGVASTRISVAGGGGGGGGVGSSRGRANLSSFSTLPPVAAAASAAAVSRARVGRVMGGAAEWEQAEEAVTAAMAPPAVRGNATAGQQQGQGRGGPVSFLPPPRAPAGPGAQRGPGPGPQGQLAQSPLLAAIMRSSGGGAAAATTVATATVGAAARGSRADDGVAGLPVGGGGGVGGAGAQGGRVTAPAATRTSTDGPRSEQAFP